MNSKLTWTILLTTILYANSSAAQVLERKQNETAQDFVNRIKPDSTKIIHSVIEVKWKGAGNSIIAFYSKPSYYTFQAITDTVRGDLIVGYIFISKGNNQYHRFVIDSFETGTTVESVFFANGDNDKEKELFVLTAHVTRPEYCKCLGTWYNSRAYNKPVAGRKDRLDALPLDFTEFEGADTNGESTAIWKNAAAVKKELKRRGYRQ